MHSLSSNAILLSACVLLVNAHNPQGRTGVGLIGYGINMYSPVCATACRDATPTSITCSGDAMDHDAMMEEEMQAPTPECLAKNPFYLQTLAFCIKTHCGDLSPDAVQDWWRSNAVGRLETTPSLLYTYESALSSITTMPTSVLGEGDMLTGVALVDEDTYLASANIDANFQIVEEMHSAFALILMTTCAGLPIFLSLFRFFPIPLRVSTRFRAYLIEAPLFSKTVRLPLWGQLFNMPTRGQALFIAYITMINIVLSFVGITTVQPNAWYTSKELEFTTYIGNRAGVLCFANLPILILYAGRNNVLLSLTGWSHSTFLILHRCVGIIAAIQACLHSAIYAQIYVASGNYWTESDMPYWYVGIISTLAFAFILPLSVRPIRAAMYEIFLILHIVLSVAAIVGAYYHIILRFSHQWGYGLYLYVAVGVWCLDRVVRLLRIARNGLTRATVQHIDKDYFRIDIPGVKAAGGHAYVYFPTLSVRFWENHPFSVVPVQNFGLSPETSVDIEKIQSIEASPSLTVQSSSSRQKETTNVLLSTSKGISLFVRKQDGLTRGLARQAKAGSSFRVLIESGYHTRPSTELRHDLKHFSKVLLVAGGVGITAVLPLIIDLNAGTITAPVKLYWTVRESALVESVESLVYEEKTTEYGHTQTAVDNKWAPVEAHITVGQRLDLSAIVEAEIGSSADETPTLVIASGPRALSSELRRLITRKGQQGSAVKFCDESFSW